MHVEQYGRPATIRFSRKARARTVQSAAATLGVMTETFDVVVAGAGSVGPMLACELRLAGVDVLVAERLPEMDRTVKAGAINVPTAQASTGAACCHS
ncbi:FAD-dependent oxidoreductase [Nocardia thraciensis]